MTGIEYEKWCANYIMKHGFEKVEVTKGSGDQGIDIIAYKDGQKYGIQCKLLNSYVSNSAVQEAFAGAAYYGCDRAMVISNNDFSKSACDLAKRINVELMARVDPSSTDVNVNMQHRLNLDYDRYWLDNIAVLQDDDSKKMIKDLEPTARSYIMSQLQGEGYCSDALFRELGRYIIYPIRIIRVYSTSPKEKILKPCVLSFCYYCRLHPEIRQTDYYIQECKRVIEFNDMLRMTQDFKEEELRGIPDHLELSAEFDMFDMYIENGSLIYNSTPRIKNNLVSSEFEWEFLPEEEVVSGLYHPLFFQKDHIRT